LKKYLAKHLIQSIWHMFWTSINTHVPYRSILCFQ